MKCLRELGDIFSFLLYVMYGHQLMVAAITDRFNSSGCCKGGNSGIFCVGLCQLYMTFCLCV